MTSRRDLHGRSFVAVLFSLALVTVGAPSALADTITFNLGTPNTAISGFTAPYEMVTVNRTSTTTATITFTSLTAGGNIYLMGAVDAVDVNVNGPFTVGSFSGSNAGIGFALPALSSAGSGNVSGFGTFNLRIDNIDGFTHSADTISFLLTLTSGSWAMASDVLTPNSSGSTAAAHVFVTSSPANAANGALATGFAANPVPEPGTITMLGGGLLALAFGMRRRWNPSL